MKNKKGLIITIAIILLVVILSIPRKIMYKDGGTVEYKAVLWSYTNYHSLRPEYKYLVGNEFKLFGITIYDNTREEAR